MSTASQDDEARWAQAQSLLDRVPDESAEQRMRHVRRLRWLLVVALLVVTTALALAIAFVVIDRYALGTDEDVPTNRAVVGIVVGAVGVVIAAVGLVVQIRAMRRVRGWRSPLYVLTRRQRKQLLAQMRGRAFVRDERVALVRHLAELLLTQRLALVAQSGLLLMFIGQWIMQPTTWRLVIVGIFGTAVLVASMLFQREAQRARAFLDEHPAPDLH